MFVAEGEKDADALRRHGFRALANVLGAPKAHGRQSYSVLAGHRVIFWPDHDDVGREQMRRTGHLTGAAAALKVFEWKNAAPKQGAHDYFAREGTADSLRRDLKDAVPFDEWCSGLPTAPAGGEPLSKPARSGAETKPVTLTDKSRVSAPRVPEWRPFPVEALPPGCRRFATEAAAARGIDVAHIGAPMLPALAGVIGNKRRLRLKASYTEPAVVWCVVVARSGVGKSSGQDDVLRPHREEERRLAEENKATLENHLEALTRHEADRGDYRRARKKDPGLAAPARPDPPPHRALLVEDITVEALADRLGDNPRGVLLARDELSGWVGGFDAYKNARGADVAHYLSMHRAGPLTVDRKDRRRPRIHVPRASVSVVGTIQPRTLARVIRSEHRENGLLARLFVTMPRETVPHWSEADVSPAAYSAWETVIGALLQVLGDEAELLLTPEARERFRCYHDELALEASAEEDDLFAALAKLRGGALRLALVLALARAAEQGRASDLQEVDLEAMEGGVSLATWFAHEARRVYASLGETSEERETRQLIDWIEARGGRVAAHELARSGPRRYRGSSEHAEKVLRQLVASGRGSVVEHPSGPSGGRPGTEFVLNLRGAETPEIAREHEGLVSAPEMEFVETPRGDTDLERRTAEIDRFLQDGQP